MESMVEIVRHLMPFVGKRIRLATYVLFFDEVLERFGFVKSINITPNGVLICLDKDKDLITADKGSTAVAPSAETGGSFLFKNNPEWEVEKREDGALYIGIYVDQGEGKKGVNSLVMVSEA